MNEIWWIIAGMLLVYGVFAINVLWIVISLSPPKIVKQENRERQVWR